MRRARSSPSSRASRSISRTVSAASRLAWCSIARRPRPWLASAVSPATCSSAAVRSAASAPSAAASAAGALGEVGVALVERRTPVGQRGSSSASSRASRSARRSSRRCASSRIRATSSRAAAISARAAATSASTCDTALLGPTDVVGGLGARLLGGGEGLLRQRSGMRSALAPGAAARTWSARLGSPPPGGGRARRRRRRRSRPSGSRSVSADLATGAGGDARRARRASATATTSATTVSGSTAPPLSSQRPDAHAPRHRRHAPRRRCSTRAGTAVKLRCRTSGPGEPPGMSAGLTAAGPATTALPPEVPGPPGPLRCVDAPESSGVSTSLGGATSGRAPSRARARRARRR